MRDDLKKGDNHDVQTFGQQPKSAMKRVRIRYFPVRADIAGESPHDAVTLTAACRFRREPVVENKYHGKSSETNESDEGKTKGIIRRFAL